MLVIKASVDKLAIYDLANELEACLTDYSKPDTNVVTQILSRDEHESGNHGFKYSEYTQSRDSQAKDITEHWIFKIVTASESSHY